MEGKKKYDLESIINRKWRIIGDSIGEGATKEVYLVSNIVHEAISQAGLPDEDWKDEATLGVLKIIKKDGRLPPALASITIPREIKTLRGIQEAHIVDGVTRILDGDKLDNEEDAFFYVEEYVPGNKNFAHPSFHDNIREAIRIGAQVGKTLDHLQNLRKREHVISITHGDIKPANILISPEGESKLSDFGSARLGEGKPVFPTSVLYCAPEVFEEKISPASDVYSLGATLYQVLTGQPPFTSSERDWKELTRTEVSTQREELRLKHRTERPVAPHILNPKIPAKVSEAILNSLAKDPEKRPSALNFSKFLGGDSNERLWWFKESQFQEKTNDSDRIRKNYQELIALLGEERVVPSLHKLSPGKFPFAIFEGEESWTMAGVNYWSCARMPAAGILLYEKTGDERYLLPVLERLDDFFDNYESHGAGDAVADSSVTLADASRLLFAPLAKIGPTMEIRKKCSEFVDRSLDIIVNKFFDSKRSFIRTTLQGSATHGLRPSAFALVAPFLAENGHSDIALNHIETSTNFLMRSDGSIRERWELDESGKGGHESQERGYQSKKFENQVDVNSPNAHLALDQSFLVYGLAKVYEATGRKDILAKAEKTLSYIERRREEMSRVSPNLDILAWDLEVPDEELRNKKMNFPDSYSTGLLLNASLCLARVHPDITSRKKYRESSFKDIEILVDNYLALGKGYEGIIKGAFRGVEEIRETNCCLAAGDYNFLQALNEASKIS